MNEVWKSFAAQEITHSMAHYLTTLLKLKGERGYARVSDVAKELEVTKGSVSTQMKHLKEKGLVVEDENRFLRLTDEGESTAKEVLQNRQVLIRFIEDVLGIDPLQAETDACKIEHLLSRNTSNQLMALVQLLQSDEAPAKKFIEAFKHYKISCPSHEDCNLCSTECLADCVDEPTE